MTGQKQKNPAEELNDRLVEAMDEIQDVGRWTAGNEALESNASVIEICRQIVELMFEIRGEDLKDADGFRGWVQRVRGIKVKLSLNLLFVLRGLDWSRDRTISWSVSTPTSEGTRGCLCSMMRQGARLPCSR